MGVARFGGELRRTAAWCVAAGRDYESVRFALQLAADVGGEAVEEGGHVVGAGHAGFDDHVADADFAEDGKLVHDLGGGAPGRESQADAQGDLGGIALDPGAGLLQFRQPLAHHLGGREGGVPAVAQLGHPA